MNTLVRIYQCLKVEHRLHKDITHNIYRATEQAWPTRFEEKSQLDEIAFLGLV
jgi:hypothetical protein